MDYAFPPPSSAAVMRHYVLLAWLIMVTALFVWRLVRPVRVWEPFLWLPGVGLVTVWLEDRLRSPHITRMSNVARCPTT